MTEALIDFPPIEAPPYTPPTPALVATPPPALPEVPSIKATVLAQFKDAESTILALAEKYRAVAYDVTTTKGMDEAKAARLELREKGRFAVQRAEKAVKADVNDLKRVMADEVDRLVAIVQPVEDAIDGQIKAEEARKAAAKAERDRIEAERVARHQAGIAKISTYLTRCQEPGMTADRISIGIGMLEGVKFGPEWEEFSVPAANAQCETLEAMRVLHAQAVEREAEAARLEAQRVENERVAREQAEQRAELARQAEALKAQQQRIAGLQARIAEIRCAATGHEKASAADLREAAVAVAALDVSEAQYAEFAALAQAERATTLAVLEKLHADAVQRKHDEKVSRAEPAPAVEYPEGQDSQQVLKAEGDSPDATDRDAPADTSPRVGAMGAGQAADAAPMLEPGIYHGPTITDANGDTSRVTVVVSPPMAGTVTADPAPADPQAAFLALVMSAFDCKFPSHPKPSIAWWAAVRKAGEELQGAA